MIRFYNKVFNVEEVNWSDIFICAVGYEQRSQYLLNQIRDKIDPHNILVFYFDDFKKYEHVQNYLELLNKDIQCLEKKYEDGNEVKEEVIHFVQTHISGESAIHIDYSSMPRNWYCQLPMDNNLLQKEKVFFWYVEGKYPMSYDTYPSAGIESYSVIGTPSLRMGQKRLHVIGLGYDTIRTKALVSILDPDMYSVCAAFKTGDKEVEENVQQVNSQIISQAVSEAFLPLDDFSFMIAKLCEIATEYLPLGDVVFVPDGPKPLVMAMSLVPSILNRSGISCLHVSRNNKCYEPVKVMASKKILGFSLNT